MFCNMRHQEMEIEDKLRVFELKIYVLINFFHKLHDFFGEKHYIT